MRKRHRRFVAGGLVLAALWGSVLQAAPTKFPGAVEDSYQLAQEAGAGRRYEAAIALLRQFLSSSVGDPRAAKAQKLLQDATVALAKDYDAAGRGCDAAALYVELANDTNTPADSKDSYLKQAEKILTTGLADAQQKHLADRALQFGKAWGKLFASKPALLTREQVDTLTADAVVAAYQDKLNQLALPDVLAYYYPAGDIPWSELNKRNRDQPLMAGYFRSLAELGWCGRYIAEYQKLDKDSPLRSDSAFVSQTERIFLRRVEAFVFQGNVGLAQEAIVTARNEITSDSVLSQLKTAESKLPPNVHDIIANQESSLPDLTFKDPINTKATWSDKGQGYKEAKDIVLEENADVTVNPGFVINGGTITVKRAALRLKGTPAQPVIFRNVHFCLEISGHLDAQNAILIGCTFSKTGGAYWINGYSSKWAFSQCLLYRCHFSHLKQIDYGVQISNSAWVESNLPDRTPMKGTDFAAMYTGRWDQVTGTMFYRVRVSPSVVWMTSKCNFIRCVADTADFKSKTGMVIQLFAPDADPIGAELRANTTISDVQEVRYGFARKPYDCPVPAAFWAMLPIELPDGMTQRK
jgi:hypothetical protein